MKKILRTHDELYLKENRYENTKDSFSFLVKLLKKETVDKQYTLLDVGCANGELLYLLRKKFNNFKLSGVDIRKDLLIKAKKKLGDDIKFFRKDIFKKALNQKFDFIICSGVIGITDNPKKLLMNLIKMKKKRGSVYLFHHFNEDNFNVYVKYQKLDNKSALESGWNIFSLKYIKSICGKYRVKFFKFVIKKKIFPNKLDKIRSWTIKLDNKNCFTNGLSILLKQFWIKIS
jgi:SAM-dependent methyltransferase